MLIGFSSITSYAAYSCNPSPLSIRSAPDSRYKIIGDGTEVKDKRTGLIWQRCALGRTYDNGKCVGVTNVYGWKKLNELEKSLREGERVVGQYSSKNYRVPTVYELETLIEKACSEDFVGAIAINTTIFPNTQHWFSSITTDPNDEKRSLSILYMHGSNGKRYSYPKELPTGGRVRLVRDN